MILHIDMDAFYASVEERDRPELTGLPVVVGGTPEGRGVVAAANYAARKFGVHSALPAATAKRLCPHAVFLPVRMSHYAAVSKQIREIFARYTPLVEPLSLDEAFLDLSGTERLFGSAEHVGRSIKNDIRRELHLTASVGVAPNKFLAKIASDLKKPDGFVVVAPDQVGEFLAPLPVSRIWGVGRVAEARLQRIGIRTIGQLRQLALSVLEEQFGKHGGHLWNLAQGIDDRRVVPDHAARSISHETTFARDVADLDLLQTWLCELADQVARRLRRHQLVGKTVQLKIRYGDFQTYTRRHSLAIPTDSTDEILKAARDLLLNHRPHRRLSIRLLGVGVTGITRAGGVQRTLFDREEQEQRSRLDHVADAIRDKFGDGALKRAGAIRRDETPPP